MTHMVSQGVLGGSFTSAPTSQLQPGGSLGWVTRNVWSLGALGMENPMVNISKIHFFHFLDDLIMNLNW